MTFDSRAFLNSTLRSWRPVATAVLVVSLAGCAGYSPSKVKNGQSAAEVAQLMGQPTGRYPIPGGGERLEYARGPAGKETFMVDLDTGGRVTGWSQVLTEPNFESLKRGTTEQDLLFMLGRPASKGFIGFQHRFLWNYRYQSMGYCRWFQVSLNEQHKVVDSGYGPDPECDPGIKDMGH